jgi:membrane protein DedA with SNARE-associated domain
MKRVLIGVVLLGLVAGTTSCAAPVALGAAVVGAGAGAQAGWWFGKSSKQASEAKEKKDTKDKKEATHAVSGSQ